MPRRIFKAGLLAVFAALASALFFLPGTLSADINEVSSSVPRFIPLQPVTITVLAEDDDGVLIIQSNLAGSTLTVTNCVGIGANQVAAKCDGTGMTAVTGNGSTLVAIDTISLDGDAEPEALTVTLTLVASCSTETIVTVSADQPLNAGPDNVTINCVPATPTPSPTPSPTPTQTATPAPSTTPLPTSTPVPPTPAPIPPVDLVIQPPSTGDAGLR